MAGQESEKTNEFLQMLSIAILKQVRVCVCVCGCGCVGVGGWVGGWVDGCTWTCIGIGSLIPSLPLQSLQLLYMLVSMVTCYDSRCGQMVATLRRVGTGQQILRPFLCCLFKGGPFIR